MNETEAIVCGLEGSIVLLEPQTQAGCGRCQEPGGCGGVSAATMFCARQKRVYQALNPAGLPLKVGDRVRVGIPEGSLLRTALLSYGLPLLGLVGGGVALPWGLGRDHSGWQILGATLGFALCSGLLWLWNVRQRQKHGASLVQVLARLP